MLAINQILISILIQITYSIHLYYATRIWDVDKLWLEETTCSYAYCENILVETGRE